MSLDELLKTLRQDYLKTLPEKIKQVHEFVQLERHAEIQDSFHKLKGTGTTYGLPEVSNLGALVEAICIKDSSLGKTAASLAAELMQEVYNAKTSSRSFELHTDPRHKLLQDLLAS